MTRIICATLVLAVVFTQCEGIPVVTEATGVEALAPELSATALAALTTLPEIEAWAPPHSETSSKSLAFAAVVGSTTTTMMTTKPKSHEGHPGSFRYAKDFVAWLCHVAWTWILKLLNAAYQAIVYVYNWVRSTSAGEAVAERLRSVRSLSANDWWNAGTRALSQFTYAVTWTLGFVKFIGIKLATGVVKVGSMLATGAVRVLQYVGVLDPSAAKSWTDCVSANEIRAAAVSFVNLFTLVNAAKWAASIIQGAIDFGSTTVSTTVSTISTIVKSVVPSFFWNTTPSHDGKHHDPTQGKHKGKKHSDDGQLPNRYTWATSVAQCCPANTEADSCQTMDKAKTEPKNAKPKAKTEPKNAKPKAKTEPKNAKLNEPTPTSESLMSWMFKKICQTVCSMLYYVIMFLSILFAILSILFVILSMIGKVTWGMVKATARTFYEWVRCKAWPFFCDVVCPRAWRCMVSTAQTVRYVSSYFITGVCWLYDQWQASNAEEPKEAEAEVRRRGAERLHAEAEAEAEVRRREEARAARQAEAEAAAKEAAAKEAAEAEAVRRQKKKQARIKKPYEVLLEKARAQEQEANKMLAKEKIKL